MRKFPEILFKLNFWILFLIAAQVAAIIFLAFYIPYFLPVALTFVIVWLLSAVCAALLFARKGSADVKCVWFVIIAAVPVAGALIYLLATVKRRPHAILNVKKEGENGIYSAANALCGTCSAGYSAAKYFENGTEFFSSAIPAIKGAKKNVYMEFFIISRGHIFNSLIQALETAAANGAEIKIILDGVGSAFRVNKKDLKRLKAVGAEVKIFHKLTPFPHAKINVRDHRKIIAIDGKTAYTGGVNLADEYANIVLPHGYWKDTGVAVYGSAAKIFEGMFLSMWHGKYEMSAPDLNPEEKLCLPFYDSPPHRSFCEDAYISAIYSSRERVHIFTPYFCVSDKTAAALAFTAQRGVDVKIIIPHIPDKKYAFEISKAFARTLTESGVKFFEFTPGFMHAKSLICDNKVFLGSYNFDFRSTRYNYECGILFENDICNEVERDFQNCLALSMPLTEGKLSRLKRTSRFILRFFAPLI